MDHLPDADYHSQQGVLGEDDGQAGLLLDQKIYASKQGPAARKYDAPVNYISGKFRRRVFKSDLDGIEDAVDRLGQCVAYLVFVDRYRFWYSRYQVPPFDVFHPLLCI